MIANLNALLFWFLATITVLGGVAVLLFPNPIYSALALAFTMVGVAGLFITLKAYFVAGVQIVVYAGAVMVLFVMVLMIFDLKGETNKAFSRGKFTGFIKISSIAMLSGLAVGAILMSAEAMWNEIGKLNDLGLTEVLSKMIFTKYLFAFEAMGILLLVVAIGVVAMARAKGGTHE